MFFTILLQFRIAIEGASNGGLTVVASSLQRPDLFGAVIGLSG